MADKEATVFIVDVAKSMNRKRHGRDQTDLEWSLQYFWDKITNLVYLGRKTLFAGVLGLGTDGTKHQLSGDEGYEHITLFQAIQPMLMEHLRDLPPKIKPSNTDRGDALSAIILAVDMILRHCRHLQYKKKIILITNAAGAIDADEEDIKEVADKIKANNIDLTILGVDFDDSGYGVKEEDKSSTKASNERQLKKLVDRCGGILATMQEAIDGLSIPFIKPVRPTPTYKGQLRLGDPEKYDTAITIDVERYFKVSVRRPPTASSFVVRGDVSQDDGLMNIAHSRTYKVSDPDHPGNQKDVLREELAKGYEYGRTAVHISESDENISKLETEAGYDILGFIPKDNVERYFVLENTNMLVAQRFNDKATIALSSFIRALYEIESCAVARLVKKDMTEPQLTLLTPLIEPDCECLIENVLPFAEDLRQYRFPPLDKVVTVSGKHLAAHRNLPNDDLISSMGDFVDNMMLMDDDERMPIDETFSPVNFSVESAIKHRAVHPDDEIPAIPDAFLAYSRQPLDLQERSRSALERIIKAADIKKVPPKVKGRQKYRHVEKPLSGLDVEELFRREKRTHISPDNAISEFRQALENQGSADQIIGNSIKQMEVIIKDRIKNSFGDGNYERVIEELGVVRDEMIEYEEPDLYNKLIERLKKDILSESLGGNRKELWWKIKVKKLGLIDREQSDQSNVSSEQANAFLYAK